jgi:competence protein ComEC
MVGFQLSAGACVGIVWLSPAIARALPGPRAIAEALAVTIGAQAGVAPVLVTVFGGIPVAGVPANLLVAPAAGPVMMWGMAAGIGAGLLGRPAASVLHWPTHLLIAWIAGVAHWAAALPLGEIGARELVVVAAGVALMTAASFVGFAGVRRAGAVLVGAAVIAPALSLRAPPPVHTALSTGTTLWRADASVLDIDGRVDAASVLEALRRAGVSQLDVVIVRTENEATTDTLDALRPRFDLERVLTPSMSTSTAVFAVGRLSVEVHRSGEHLTVEIELASSALARGPPGGPARSPSHAPDRSRQAAV